MANILPRDRHSSMPRTKPMGMDHRGITAHDIDAALEHARYGVQPDYRNEGPRYPGRGGVGGGAPVPLPPRTPYPGVRFDDGDVHRGGSHNHHHQHQQQHQHQHQHHQPPHQSHRNNHHEMDLNELVRKTNLAVALANHNISHRAQFSQIHPMMCPDGRFPADFQLPKTVESVRLFDNTQLDRILQAYRLPFENRVLLALNPSHQHHHGPRGGGGSDLQFSPSRMRHTKLQVLFEHLGAIRIVEREKVKRVAFM